MLSPDHDRETDRTPKSTSRRLRPGCWFMCSIVADPEDSAGVERSEPPGEIRLDRRLPSRPVSNYEVELIDGEAEYLARQSGANFFLALAPYLNALERRERIREIISALESEMREKLDHFVREQNDLVEEAKALRAELAEHAPEVDNSDMEEPDHASHDYTRYDLDSFASFDRLVAADTTRGVGYPTLPTDDRDQTAVSKLLQILRGRVLAADMARTETSTLHRYEMISATYAAG
jgi:hypothetical protein